ncbi:hypothetical protein MtrunA17_Chr3g0132741 [Medicago truncatula]|uniref:Uncharacterized protein n=1 Tax=Medicago truncatula TaxID=3880 RepID=A0A396IWU5_MEDTR|nr:hypothetical protein MtrunA17_Chr3g0132741 [Medicago truncatula]
MSPADVCTRCNSANKDVFHCLQDWAFPRKLWLAIGFNSINFFLKHQPSLVLAFRMSFMLSF